MRNVSFQAQSQIKNESSSPHGGDVTLSNNVTTRMNLLSLLKQHRSEAEEPLREKQRHKNLLKYSFANFYALIVLLSL